MIVPWKWSKGICEKVFKLIIIMRQNFHKCEFQIIFQLRRYLPENYTNENSLPCFSSPLLVFPLTAKERCVFVGMLPKWFQVAYRKQIYQNKPAPYIQICSKKCKTQTQIHKAVGAILRKGNVIETKNLKIFLFSHFYSKFCFEAEHVMLSPRFFSPNFCKIWYRVE